MDGLIAGLMDGHVAVWWNGQPVVLVDVFVVGRQAGYVNGHVADRTTKTTRAPVPTGQTGLEPTLG
ncbi:MAG: hypothetical protein HQK57_12235 [Deltaproteobacteria bacterium]|nr:hypothetical protein [Deltaproteobacteria bacterium]